MQVILKLSVLITQYCSGDQVERNEKGGECNTTGWRRGVQRVLVGKIERKGSLGRPRRRREDNVTTDIQEVGYGAWTRSIWLRIGTGGGHL